MTAEQLDALVDRSAAGEGVESVIASMGLSVASEMDELWKNPTARDRLKAAKKAQKSDPVALARIAVAAAAKARVGL